MELAQELEELSKEATPGPWYQGDIVEGQLIGQWQEIGPVDDPCRLYAFMAADANFIVALVNAYRAGQLLDATTIERLTEALRVAHGALSIGGPYFKSIANAVAPILDPAAPGCR